MKTLCIIQARMSSTRLPGKVLLPLVGIPMLEYQLQRVKKAKKIDKIVIATSTKPADDEIEKVATTTGIGCFRGDEQDVLSRYYYCAKNESDYLTIVRLTGDCPLIDYAVIDDTIRFFENGSFDFAGNVDPATFPDGMDVEVFSFTALEKSFREAQKPSEREHITQYMRKNPDIFKMGNYTSPTDYSDFRLTVDEPADYEVVKLVAENCDVADNYLTYVKFLQDNPSIRLKNTSIERNEGLAKSLAKEVSEEKINKTNL